MINWALTLPFLSQQGTDDVLVWIKKLWCIFVFISPPPSTISCSSPLSSTSTPLHLHVATYRCRDLPNREMNEYVGTINWMDRTNSLKWKMLASCRNVISLRLWSHDDDAWCFSFHLFSGQVWRWRIPSLWHRRADDLTWYLVQVGNACRCRNQNSTLTLVAWPWPPMTCATPRIL